MDKARVRPVTGIQQAFFLREIPVGDSGEFQQRVNQPVGLVRLMAVRLCSGGNFGTRLAVFGGEPQQKWDLIARVDVRITGDPVGHSRIKCFAVIREIEQERRTLQRLEPGQQRIEQPVGESD